MNWPDLISKLDRIQRGADEQGDPEFARTVRIVRDRLALQHYGEAFCHHESRNLAGICECGDRR